MIINNLIIVCIGHVLGDFYFQTEKLAKEKDEKPDGVIKHSVEYWITVFIVTVLAMDLKTAAILSTVLALLHFIIDLLKYILLKKKIIKNISDRIIFLTDQSLHIVCIVAVVYIIHQLNGNNGYSVAYSILRNFLKDINVDAAILGKWILILLIIHKPTNILIKILLNDYKPHENHEEQKLQDAQKSLKIPEPQDAQKIHLIDDKNAGRYIGTLERVIMLMFLATNQYSAMGLVLTAKSIARYDRISKDEAFAEYYLLGTLLSTACVVACNMIILR